MSARQLFQLLYFVGIPRAECVDIRLCLKMFSVCNFVYCQSLKDALVCQSTRKPNPLHLIPTIPTPRLYLPLQNTELYVCTTRGGICDMKMAAFLREKVLFFAVVLRTYYLFKIIRSSRVYTECVVKSLPYCGACMINVVGYSFYLNNCNSKIMDLSETI